MMMFNGAQPSGSRERLLKALANRKVGPAASQAAKAAITARDARYASLPALPAYAETNNNFDGDTDGHGRNDIGGFQGEHGGFQSNDYQGA